MVLPIDKTTLIVTIFMLTGLVSLNASAGETPADLVFSDDFDEAFQDCLECPTMVLVPGGTFTQGSPESDPVSDNEERPQREVTVPAFAIGQTEVTFAEWDACVADGGCTHDPADSGWGRGNRPVIDVSWDDAQEYVTWLSNKTGQDYRLPSESEWEYATRAGTTGRFNTGECITTDQANFRADGPAAGCPEGIFRAETLPVGSFAPNAFGLYDTHGNAWEWVEDCWNENYTGAPTDGSAWVTGDCSDAVLRGGSWSNFVGALRSASRFKVSRDSGLNNFGFRVAKSLDTTFRDCAGCPTMVEVPGGTFTQGSPESEPESESDERPQREVSVPAFAIGQTEVTFAEWDACVADGGCSYTPDDAGWGREDRPVINVNWNDAQEYVTWLSTKTGQNYRLPSESEWEFATRAGTTGRFNTGDCITVDQANFRGTAPAQGCPSGIYRQETLPVGSFAPNALGLFDTHGNVYEWVEDCWNENYTGAPTDGSAWTTGGCGQAVMRGGSLNFDGPFLRSASRNRFARGTRSAFFGFRVARSVVTTFRDCPDCPTMVEVSGGTFTQGSPESEPQSESDERPQREVSVPAFAIGQTEVTFAQWDACVADGGCGYTPDDAGWGREDQPVINVNWNDAQEYVTWLSNKTGQDYRLPSESEWEYATRAGTTGRFNTGDCITTDQANFKGNTPAAGCPSSIWRQETLSVGSFAPNAFGLYDTHGNVYEWVEDCWNGNYAGAPTDGSAWMTGDCSLAMLRGGSWNFIGRGLRSANRFWNARDIRNVINGFRVARSGAL